MKYCGPMSAPFQEKSNRTYAPIPRFTVEFKRHVITALTCRDSYKSISSRCILPVFGSKSSSASKTRAPGVEIWHDWRYGILHPAELQ
jgi:hypothetical protein